MIGGEDLPRLLHDPETGFTALEFLPLKGNDPRTIDRRMIIGATLTDIRDPAGAIIHERVGALDTIGVMLPTAHSYYVLRDLLYPMQKEGPY